MKLRLLLAALGLVLLAAACAPTPQIRSDRYLADDSLITGEPCGPPCWRGIIPGETSWEDAVITIQDDPQLTGFEQRTDEGTDSRGAVWSPEDGDRCCQMISRDGDIVTFLLLQTTPDIALETALEEHGDPDYLVGELFTNDQALFSLFYEEVPMIVYVFVAGEDGEISATSEVVGFAYTTEEDMELIVSTNNLHTWEGYQSYSAYVDSEFEVTPSVTLTPSGEDE